MGRQVDTSSITTRLGWWPVGSPHPVAGASGVPGCLLVGEGVVDAAIHGQQF